MAVLMTLETAGLAALQAGRFLFVRERWAELQPCAGIVTSNTGQYCIEYCTRLASLLSPERPKNEETLIDEKHLVKSELGCVSHSAGRIPGVLFLSCWMLYYSLHFIRTPETEIR